MNEKLTDEQRQAVENAQIPTAAAIARQAVTDAVDRKIREFCVEQAVKAVATTTMSHADFAALLQELYRFMRGDADARA